MVDWGLLSFVAVYSAKSLFYKLQLYFHGRKESWYQELILYLVFSVPWADVFMQELRYFGTMIFYSIHWILHRLEGVICIKHVLPAQLKADLGQHALPCPLGRRRHPPEWWGAWTPKPLEWIISSGWALLASLCFLCTHHGYSLFSATCGRSHFFVLGIP